MSTSRKTVPWTWFPSQARALPRWETTATSTGAAAACLFMA